MNIGKAIETLRKEHDASQIEFAESIGITQSYLSLIENGHKTPSLEVIKKVADSVNVPLAVLFWFSVEREDIRSEEKFKTYDILKPMIDKMIMLVFNDYITIK